MASFYLPMEKHMPKKDGQLMPLLNQIRSIIDTEQYTAPYFRKSEMIKILDHAQLHFDEEYCADRFFSYHLPKGDWEPQVTVDSHPTVENARRLLNLLVESSKEDFTDMMAGQIMAHGIVSETAVIAKDIITSISGDIFDLDSIPSKDFFEIINIWSEDTPFSDENSIDIEEIDHLCKHWKKKNSRKDKVKKKKAEASNLITLVEHLPEDLMLRVKEINWQENIITIKLKDIK